jgi:peptide chain release factor 1
LRKRFGTLERDVKLLLLPKGFRRQFQRHCRSPRRHGRRRGFAVRGDLLKMYTRYAQLQGWKAELLSLSESDLGGVKEAVLGVEGEGAYAKLKFESGVHRVQRVPVTEASGRIHTSAATVAVLPEPEDVDVDVQEKDLRIDVYRAAGAGGQHVNKTGIRRSHHHLPTGIVVAMQEGKVAHKNRAKAMKILKARLFEASASGQAERARRRAQRPGRLGDRSERIRTYNFPQGLEYSGSPIQSDALQTCRIISGDDLSESSYALVTEDQASRLAAEEAA